jgi:hypothetical protein
MIESKRFQNGSLTLVKNKTTHDTWFLRFYEEAGGKRVYRRQRIATRKRRSWLFAERSTMRSAHH